MMKKIINTSLQSWSLPFRTPQGVKSYYLMPKQAIQVPASYLTDHVIRFEERKLITIRNA